MAAGVVVADDRLDAVLAALDGPGPVAVVPSGRPVPPGLRAALGRAPAGTWLVALTSGSTAHPRAVCRTRASWTASADALARLTGTGVGTRVLVPGPAASTLFLHAAWHARAVGAVPVAAPLGTSLAWDVVHLVPHQLQTLLDAPARGVGGGRTDPAPRDLAGRTAVVAGAALPSALAARAHDRGLRLLAYYGSAELSFVAAGDPGEDPDGALAPFPGVQVRLLDGEIWARSALLCSGYLPLGADVRPGPGPLRQADGWASVGDRGEWTSRGRLRVLGRGGNVVQAGGATVLVADVEAALRAVPGVRDIAVLGVPHAVLGEVVGAVVEAPPGTVDVPALRAGAAAALLPAQRPRRWRVVAALPRTDAGKVDRQAAAALLARPRPAGAGPAPAPGP